MTKLTIPKAYDAWSKSYDSPNMLIAMERNILLDLAGDVTGKKVLDAGCGTGRQAIKFAKNGAKVFGQDISKGMISKAIENSIGWDIKYKVGNLKKIKFQDDYFDIIINSLVLDHIKNPNIVFKEFNRVLKQKGIVLITTVDPFTPLNVVGARFMQDGKEIWIKSFTHSFEDYFTAIKTNGFELVDLKEITVTDAEKKYFEAEEFRQKKGRRTLLVMKLKKK